MPESDVAAAAVAAALDGASIGGARAASPYRNAWRRAALLENTGRSGPADRIERAAIDSGQRLRPAYAPSPRSTRGATRA